MNLSDKFRYQFLVGFEIGAAKLRHQKRSFGPAYSAGYREGVRVRENAMSMAKFESTKSLTPDKAVR